MHFSFEKLLFVSENINSLLKPIQSCMILKREKIQQTFSVIYTELVNFCNVNS